MVRVRMYVGFSEEDPTAWSVRMESHDYRKNSAGRVEANPACTGCEARCPMPKTTYAAIKAAFRNLHMDCQVAIYSRNNRAQMDLQMGMASQHPMWQEASAAVRTHKHSITFVGVPEGTLNLGVSKADKIARKLRHK